MTPASERLQQMDGVRGIAMLFVFLGHFGNVWQTVHPQGAASLYLRIVDADATLGSSFFMMISAFFAYGSLRRGKRGFGEFLRGRFWRLYPLYLVMTGVYIAGSLLLPRMSKLPADERQIPVFLLETLLFLPGLLPVRPLMDVAWTLSFVVLFYFIEGLAVSLFGYFHVSRMARLGFFLWAAVCWALIGDYTHCWEPRTAMFWPGMALAEAVQPCPTEALSGRALSRAVWLVKPAGIVFFAGVILRTQLMLAHPVTPLASIIFWRFAITAVSLSAFLWICYFGPSWWKSLLSCQKLRKMGEASYSFYLTHGLAIKLFRYAVIPALGPAAGVSYIFWASQIAGLLFSIGLAWEVYLFIEKPLAELVRTKVMAVAATA